MRCSTWREAVWPAGQAHAALVCMSVVAGDFCAAAFLLCGCVRALEAARVDPHPRSAVWRQCCVNYGAIPSPTAFPTIPRHNFYRIRLAPSKAALDIFGLLQFDEISQITFPTS